MAKYITHVPIVIHMAQLLEVEADSPEQAREIALEYVEEERPDKYDKGVIFDYNLDKANDLEFDVWKKDEYRVKGEDILVLEDDE